MFITNKNVTKRDTKCDENKIKQLLRDVGYKQRGDAKCNRSKVIRGLPIKILSPEKNFTCEETAYESNEEDEIETNALSKGLRPWFPKVNPNTLSERLELLILETKSVHDGLYDEMIDITKQLLSRKNINQEQLDYFCF